MLPIKSLHLKLKILAYNDQPGGISGQGLKTGTVPAETGSR